jgi:TonB family protein
MFDTLVARAPGGSRRTRSLVIAASLVAHAAALTALALLAGWGLEKLPLEDRGGVQAAFSLPGSPPPAGGAPKVNLVAQAPERPVRPRDTVQPVAPRDPGEAAVAPGHDATGGGGDGGGGDGTGGGAGGGDGGDGDGDGTGACVGASCRPPQPPRCPDGSRPPCPALHLEPRIGDSLRVAGDTRIHAPDAVRVQMRHAGKDRVTGVVKVCIGTRGAVTSVQVLRSTGYDAYDDKLRREMRTWRYRPYTVDGRPHAFCHVVTLTYLMR